MQEQKDMPFTSQNKTLTLAEAQKMVDQWVKTYGVRYFSELTNMAVLTEEVGELARQMARIYGDQSFKQGEKPNLGDEMADVPCQPNGRRPRTRAFTQHRKENKTRLHPTHQQRKTKEIK